MIDITTQVEDIRRYDALVNTLPNRDLICGFLSGKDELMNWEASDLFQFYHDTRPIKGDLYLTKYMMKKRQ